MFQFPGFALNPYGFRVQYLRLTLRSATPPGDRSPADVTIQRVEGGFPHSEILGSKLVRSSPRHFAAYHVLHRLSAPRHPPDALTTLDRSHDPCPPLSRQHVLQPVHPRQRSTGNQKDRSSGYRPKTYFSLPNESGSSGLRGRLLEGRLRYLPHRIHSLFTMSNIRKPLHKEQGSRTSLYPDTPKPSAPWWSQTGSNRRPHACKARALPTELWPHCWVGRRVSEDDGGPGTTRTSDLTLIRGAL